MTITILEDLGSRKISGVSRFFLRCRCEKCGCEFTARKDHVTRKTRPIISCGCNQHPITGRKAYNAKPDGLAAAKNVFNSYKTKCAKKKIFFAVTFDEFVKITSHNCHYCGSFPEQEYSGVFKHGLRAGKKKVNGTYKYNGIDRIDPKLGYVAGNMRPCCRYCNSAKLDRSEADFFAWVERAYAHTRGKTNALTVRSTNPGDDAKG
jgi:hypothetical protein